MTNIANIANTEQYAAWNGESGRRWVADPDRRDRVLAPIGAALLDAARLVPGERVLDIGCGCGATSLAAAREVAPAPGGEVLGIDLSAAMLDVARQRASAAGLTNLHFRQADAQTHRLPEGSQDVAISRFGTMFFADPDAAFANLAAALRSGGRVCLATWQPLAANDWLAVPAAALSRQGATPQPGELDGSPMFAQSDPADLMAMLGAAGFSSIEVSPVALALILGPDPDAAVDYLGDVAVVRSARETVPEADQPAAFDALRAALADHVTPQGVELGAGVLITTATCDARASRR